MLEQIKNLLPKGGEAFYFKDFLNNQESLNCFELLKTHIDWKQEPITIFGKKVLQPRMTAFLGDVGKPYKYSGLTMYPQHWPGFMEELRKRVEIQCKRPFSSALLNYYRNGQDSMGWHRDNEKELGNHPFIASLSLGASRRFQFRNMQDKSLKVNLDLENGSLLIMSGLSQEYWQHALPKSPGLKLERINLTFRNIIS